MKKWFWMIGLYTALMITGCARTDKATLGETGQSATQSPVLETAAPSPSAVPAHRVITDEQKNGEDGMFQLGMTLEEVRKQLEAEGIDDSNEIENAGDPADWNQGHRTVMTDRADFTFDENERLYIIDVTDDSPTAAGLKMGDAEADVVRLYGEDSHAYELPDDGGRVLEYVMNDHYFTVLLQQQKVGGWGVSSYKWETNSPVTESYDQVKPAGDDEGTALKEKLYEELQANMQKVAQNSDDLMAAVLASDRIRGLQSIMSIVLSDAEVEEMLDQKEQVQPLLGDSVIYTGYSTQGVHLMAILSPTTPGNEKYKAAMNKLRGKEDEYAFLSAIAEASDERSLEVGLDLYAEDLTDSRKEIRLSSIAVSDSSDGTKQVTPFTGKELEPLLTQYGRKHSADLVLASGDWHAFGFMGTLINDPVITIELDGEPVILQRQ
ncbi:hypothetical protein MKZ07_01425 [Paenibacillus sp. FSL P4-0338]|uniref:hypothetical protein n=1 Tax=unclassified Paenibacillus TaxID=185978 RepID=UPI0003E2655B|nr:hypothetical protein [Paenibacillus sp. FSL R7-269]ETT30090.1 hypothetical protein C162_33775 [Paenibacillus sp. FSL R7-269]